MIARTDEAVQTLVLEGFPTPAQVRHLGPNAGTTNRYALNRARQIVQRLAKIEAGWQGIVRVPPPVTVTLRYVFPDARARDADNFGTIGKPVIDGLVRAGVLDGDDAKRLTLRVEFSVERGRRALVVELAPVGEEAQQP